MIKNTNKKISKNNIIKYKKNKKLQINITSNNTMKKLYNCENIFFKKIKNTKKLDKIEKKTKKRTISNNNKNSEIIKRIFGDSSIEANKSKKTENIIFRNVMGRKTNITRPITSLFNVKFDNIKNNEENKIKDETGINPKIIKHHNTEQNNRKKKKMFNIKQNEINNKRKAQLSDDNINNYSFLNYNEYKYSDNENNGLDTFLKGNNKNPHINNNDLFRISNISKYNNNDLYYLNNKTVLKNDLMKNKCSFIYPKNEKIEEDLMLADFLSDYNMEDDIMEIVQNEKEKKKEKLNVPIVEI